MRRATLFGILATSLTFAGIGAEEQEKVVVIAAASSSIRVLADQEIADIFLGRKATLANGERVAPLDLPEGSPTREDFYLAYTGKSPAQVKAHWSKIIFTGRGQPPDQVPDAATARMRVAGDPSLLAYVPRELVDKSVRIVSE